MNSLIHNNQLYIFSKNYQNYIFWTKKMIQFVKFDEIVKREVQFSLQSIKFKK